jgi:hypothetical protein
MSARDELFQLILGRTTTKAVERILAAGYSKPRPITTPKLDTAGLSMPTTDQLAAIEARAARGPWTSSGDVDALLALVREQAAALERVKEVHFEGVAYADDIPEGGDEEVPEDFERHFCQEDGEDWPCTTASALEPSP